LPEKERKKKKTALIIFNKPKVQEQKKGFELPRLQDGRCTY
jgi:hypothetical protein